MAFTPLSIFSEFLEQTGGTGRSNSSQLASWWYDLGLHPCRRLSLGGDLPSSNPCSWLCERKPLDLGQECVDVNVDWIKELGLTDIFFRCSFHTRNHQAQAISDRFESASRGHWVVSAGICSCHSLRVWLSRTRVFLDIIECLRV